MIKIVKKTKELDEMKVRTSTTLVTYCRTEDIHYKT